MKKMDRTKIDFENPPLACLSLILFLLFIGGCAGAPEKTYSTQGRGKSIYCVTPADTSPDLTLELEFECGRDVVCRNALNLDSSCQEVQYLDLEALEARIVAKEQTYEEN